jgi:Mn2+/Fe2+ NRAMP family transporter
MADIEEERKKTKKCAWAATIIYLVLFPFLFMFAAACIMIFDNPDMSTLFGLSIIFLCFCIPLSIPFTLYLVWSRYLKGAYKKSRRFGLIPLYFAIAAFAYNALVQEVFL